jgi:hypothetical protein
MEEFVERYEVGGISHVPDESGDLWRAFGVRSQPSWVIIPADGSDPQLIFGALGADEFAEHTG